MNADLGDSWSIVVGDLEIFLYSLGPLHEEPHRLVLGKALQWRQVHRIWQLKGRHGVLLLPVEPQGYAAGGEDIELGAATQEIPYYRCSLQDLLEVVEDQEQVLVLQVALESLRQGLPRALLESERSRDGEG